MADNPNLSRSGQVDLTGDIDALFRDKFIPEVITEYENKRKVKPFVRTKEIDKGKSASFPNIGKVDADYVNAGEVLLGNQKIAHSETTILLDPFLVSDLKLAEIDVLLAQYDDRSYVAKEMARALARKEENQLLICGCLAARAGGMVAGRPGGTVVKAQGCAENAEKLAAGIYAAGVAMREKDVPFEDIAVFLRPTQVALLAQFDKITDKNLGGSGNYAEGYVGKIGGIKVIETNFLPNENIPQATGDKAKPNGTYYGDFSNTVGLVMHKGAVGSISRKGLTMEYTWLPQELVWLITARNLQGHGILDPRCAVEIVDEA